MNEENFADHRLCMQHASSKVLDNLWVSGLLDRLWYVFWPTSESLGKSVIAIATSEQTRLGLPPSLLLHGGDDLPGADAHPDRHERKHCGDQEYHARAGQREECQSPAQEEGTAGAKCGPCADERDGSHEARPAFAGMKARKFWREEYDEFRAMDYSPTKLSTISSEIPVLVRIVT